ncbi:MAG: amidohydrolase family protein [Gemmatimonadaceae bacterium]|nr:amidohydrolase family protein [Gemmatimonadaceae bacterium]
MTDGATVRIDAHQHYWRFDPVRDAWIDASMPALRRDWLPVDVVPALRCARVDGVVAVQASQSDGETDFLLALAAEHPFIRGVVGWTDLRAPNLAEWLAVRRGNTRLCGFRHIAQSEPMDFLRRPDVIAGIALLGEHGYSYDILIHAGQLAAAEFLVERCAGVRFVLDHCGKPPIASRELAAWRRGIAALARHEHVWCKVSGLITEAHWSRWRTDEITECLDTVAAAFGTDRLLFGSDWPVCLLAGSYAQVAELVETWALRLPAVERARLFGGTAVDVYRLEA